MKKEKQEIIPVPDVLATPMKLGEVFFASGYFTDIKSQAQAVVKILMGKELGLAPMESMNNIYITPKGDTGVMAKAVGALIKKSPKHDYMIDKIDNEGCVISFFTIDDKGNRTKVGEGSFTKEDAIKSGKVNSENYKSYPRNMFFARALLNGTRWHMPDVFCGYATEEIQELDSPTAGIETVVSMDIDKGTVEQKEVIEHVNEDKKD